MATKFKRGVAVGFILGLGSAAGIAYTFSEKANCLLKAAMAEGAASTKDLEAQGKVTIVDNTCTVRILDKVVIEAAPSIGF